MNRVQKFFATDPGIIGIMQDLSIFSSDPDKHVRMANLAIIGSHTVNGVSELHTQILRNNVFHTFCKMDSAKFINVTNGVTPRRWLLQCNPCLVRPLRSFVVLSKLITDTIQTDEWVTNLSLLSLLRDYATDSEVQQAWETAHLQAKKRLAVYIQKTQGISIPESFLFDVMVKRIHEYKRQLLDILYCIYRYQWIKGMTEEERSHVVPRVVIFGGKVDMAGEKKRRRLRPTTARRTSSSSSTTSAKW